MTSYDDYFYSKQVGGSYASASLMVPLVKELLPVRSVCDVGCGAGTWLRAWMESGVSDVLGVDGDYAVPSLQIPREAFRPSDLRERLNVGRTFDLVMSLEVAEHLPPSRSVTFVEDLTRMAPVVLFSAAVPLQSGTDHINERWQSEWAETFSRFGFEACDVIRHRIWGATKIEPWYRQNTLVFATPDAIRSHAALREVAPFPLSVVHPDLFSGGMNADSKAQLTKLFYWSLHRDVARLRRRWSGSIRV